ncbi:TIGR02450 family Trp-rich protein [Shewanella colwelliana]|nr:TIGR02450 family Trp-rich protein [Shewanella colwelliana]MCZ4338559.1 TIGR02450 family Trp-rich protein [Shewanella colwelliana]MDX1281661.1 TIGR02450 family Trp-rich protein [Shewanella colwelliana]OEG75252.1 hypothetical protein BEL05_02730 [Shewanella colwelliana]
MNKVNPKKLLHSKWTKVMPTNREKHFMLVEVEVDEDQNVLNCTIEAVMTGNQYPIEWRSLKDSEVWRMGWQ